MLTRLLPLILLLLIFSGKAYADCLYNGTSYPEGSVIGPYICSEGRWIAKQ